MLDNFQQDLENAKEAEQITLEALSALYTNYAFEDVSNQRQYFYKGDIKATDKKTGQEFYFEVKDDGRIADTRNVLCEEEVYYRGCDYYGKGNMSSDYQFYCIVSKKEKKIYILDFKILKENYKCGEYKVIPHAQQITYCYLLPLGRVRKLGGLLKEIQY